MTNMDLMHMNEEAVVDCPHCGATNEIYVDPSVRRQRYIEDCQVCFRSIDLRVQFLEGDVAVQALPV